jgi:RNA polymerase sigma-70 factor (ECF subfamily)
MAITAERAVTDRSSKISFAGASDVIGHRPDVLTDLIEAERRSPSPELRQGDEWGTPCRSEAPNEEWVRKLFEEHGRAMLAYAARLTGDRSAAEDMVQEALVRAWRRRVGPLEGKSAVRAWLFTVIRNLVVDRFRARSSRPIEVVETLMTHPVERDHADRVVDSILVFQALDSLSPGHRAVLEDVYLHGKTIRETAETLGIPAGTVKSRTYSALRSLHRLLRGPDRSEDPVAVLT